MTKRRQRVANLNKKATATCFDCHITWGEAEGAEEVKKLRDEVYYQHVTKDHRVTVEVTTVREYNNDNKVEDVIPF